MTASCGEDIVLLREAKEVGSVSIDMYRGESIEMYK